MPYEDPDPTDPMTLHGVVVETGSDDAMVEMATCFIEEYARLGFDPDRMLHMFHTRGYAGPARALQSLGERRIRQLIAAEMALRRPPPIDPESTAPSAEISLPILDTGR